MVPGAVLRLRGIAEGLATYPPRSHIGHSWATRCLFTMRVDESPLGNMDNGIARLRIVVRGAVQGVGFRPFVYRLALRMELRGWVLNSSQGVFIEAEGLGGTLELFRSRLKSEAPPRAFIQSMESAWLDAAGYEGFEIRPSDPEGETSALVLPDIAPCPDCLRELFDPADRRYLYPFINCTNCGPRYSIIEGLPYDRPNTSMKIFEMCPECRAEYEDPLNRRFHAQPNACAACGPRLSLLEPSGSRAALGEEALRGAAAALKTGSIIALKGVGGFQLLADAGDEAAVLRLRLRKRREEKPFALMFPNLESVEPACEVSEEERDLLTSAEAPIVLLRRKKESGRVSDSVAPGNPCLGVMLPSSPLHHVLLAETARPLIATSGNLSDEPICIDNDEALSRLAGVADLFLLHDRPIVRHVDDSIARVIADRGMLLRRARGYAPLPIDLRGGARSIIAFGAHLKNTVTAAARGSAFISQHIGDLESDEARAAFIRTAGDMTRLFGISPDAAVCDMHPDYLSTREADSSSLPLIRVQHHHAHAAACMADNGLSGDVLAVVWDGTGYGPDGTVWGGEFLIASEAAYSRYTSLRTFPLPGGDRAAREPRRAALGLLFELFGDDAFGLGDLPPLRAFSDGALRILRRALEKKINSPRTSSAGRLFDAAASLCGIRQICSYEGQAAMEMEWKGEGGKGEGTRGKVDWGPMMIELIEDCRAGVDAGVISARFHRMLAEMIVGVAKAAGLERVLLSGGCFQNRTLTELAVGMLSREGFRPYRHQRVPPNDGCISLGQAVVASAIFAGKK